MNRRILSAIILSALLTTITGCSSKSNGNVNTPTTTNTTTQEQKQSSSGENQQIYDFIQEQFKTNSKDAPVFVSASEKFKRPIIEVMRAYMLASNAKVNLKVTEAELDTMNMDTIKQLYVNKDGKWYYNNKEINVGTALPIPDSMKEKSPNQGKEINVNISLETTSNSGNLNIKAKINLPNTTQVMIRILNASDKNMITQDFNPKVSNGQFSTSFSSLAPGNYIIEITTPSSSVLDAEAKAKVGESGANLTGKYVVFDKVFGKTVKYESPITIK